MEKIDLTKQFSHRLKEAMIKAGYNSSRSSSGVCVHSLAKITGYSEQICRKYLRGEAFPEPIKLIEIARHLKVSPGWMLFGACHDETLADLGHVTIAKDLLQYIFNQCATMYNGAMETNEVALFLVDLVLDVSLIKADDSQSKKIIDLALSSFHRFNQTNGK